jgi:hypothetical protein
MLYNLLVKPRVCGCDRSGPTRATVKDYIDGSTEFDDFARVKVIVGTPVLFVTFPTFSAFPAFFTAIFTFLALNTVDTFLLASLPLSCSLSSLESSPKFPIADAGPVVRIRLDRSFWVAVGLDIEIVDDLERVSIAAI